MEVHELRWLAGLLEGEGSFMRGPPSAPNSPAIGLCMTDIDVVQHAALLLGNPYIHIRTDSRGKWKTAYQFRCRGRRAVEFMLLLKPHMGERRRKQIEEALRDYIYREAGDNTRKLTREAVAQARVRLAGGESLLAVSKSLGVSRVTLRKARDRKTWKNIA